MANLLLVVLVILGGQLVYCIFVGQVIAWGFRLLSLLDNFGGGKE
jgi:hypothetical protein